MFALFKCILGLCIVLCFVQFIDMARIVRDDTAAKDSATDLVNSLQNIFSDVLGKINNALDKEQVQKLFDDAGKVLADSARVAQNKIAELSENAAKAQEKN